MHRITQRKLLWLKPEEILPVSPLPRKNFDLYDLQRLADSIATAGILVPLSVRKRSDNTVELIDGARRLRAAEMAGIRRIPCFAVYADEPSAACFGIAENIQRKALTPFEQAKAIEQLMERYHLSQSEVAIRLGVPATALSEKLRLLRLSPELRTRITDAGLNERYAKALLRLPDEKQNTVLDRILAEGLTLRQTEALVEKASRPQAEEPTEKMPPVPTRKMAIGDLRLFANSLAKLVDTMISAGIPTQSQKSETEEYLEYRIRIRKPTPPSADAPAEYQQLKIC